MNQNTELQSPLTVDTSTKHLRLRKYCERGDGMVCQPAPQVPLLPLEAIGRSNLYNYIKHDQSCCEFQCAQRSHDQKLVSHLIFWVEWISNPRHELLDEKLVSISRIKSLQPFKRLLNSSLLYTHSDDSSGPVQ